jgi:hypothetical protein
MRHRMPAPNDRERFPTVLDSSFGRATSMLGSMDENGPSVLVDLVGDAEPTAPRLVGALRRVAERHVRAGSATNEHPGVGQAKESARSCRNRLNLALRASRIQESARTCLWRRNGRPTH